MGNFRPHSPASNASSAVAAAPAVGAAWMGRGAAASVRMLRDLMFHAPREMTRLAAASAILDRLCGKPEAQTVNHRDGGTTLEALILASMKSDGTQR